ncbi:MAG: HAMP domain-containing protein [Gammaproteobacteria bacterium]|nr:HAMP domain-containing protein [Gammaproteobacteria bacterium]
MSQGGRRELYGVVTLFALLILALYLMGRSLEDPSAGANIYGWILFINAIALFGFIVVVGRRAWVLWRSLQRGDDGAKLTSRLVIALSTLALLPVLIIYFFSLRFIQTGINRWYDVNVENALQNSLELSQRSAASTLGLLNQISATAAEDVALWELDPSAEQIDNLIVQLGALELSLIKDNGEIVFTSGGASIGDLQPQIPAREFLQDAVNTQQVAYLDSLPDKGLVATTLTLVPSLTADVPQVLVMMFPLDEATNALANEVENVYSQYKQLLFLRTPLRLSFVLTLSMALALSLLMAIWVSFLTARWLMLPIRQLAAGTRSVAEGNYSQRLAVNTNDELGFLVLSFNRMTSKLEQMQMQNDRHQLALETERAYLQAVFGQLSSGVIVLEPNFSVRTANQAAAELLGVELEELMAAVFNPSQPQSMIPESVLQPFADQHAFEVQWESQADARTRQMVCRATPLVQKLSTSWILVLDDISDIVRTQRDAAWGEAARRLAHEIKNPLTPIQLSAERLARKLDGKLEQSDALLLNKSTSTIVSQVDSLKSMVNAFAQYAASPQLDNRRLNLTEIAESVVTLYQGLERADVCLLDSAPAWILGDANRLRQMLINLIKNAVEALAEQSSMDQPPGHVSVSVTCDQQHVVLSVLDNGPGFDQSLIGRIYEPYVTTKSKGTGIGLAVVNKIADEHGAKLELGANPPQGARVDVIFAVSPNDETE